MKIFCTLFLSFLVSACASTTEEGAVGVRRSQLALISSDQINQMSAQSYDQTKEEAKQKRALDTNPEYFKRVSQIAQRITPQTSIFRRDAPKWSWEVHVITSEEINAYCMPGGKIMFYSNLIEKLKLTDAEIAAVMGHEIAHALREHGKERMSEDILKNASLQGLVIAGVLDERAAQIANLASTFLSLKFSRTQESEADEMGLELMARAGYDPREAVNLWKKMSSLGGHPPELLSDHPADTRRIADIERLLPKVIPLYELTTH